MRWSGALGAYHCTALHCRCNVPHWNPVVPHDAVCDLTVDFEMPCSRSLLNMPTLLPCHSPCSHPNMLHPPHSQLQMSRSSQPSPNATLPTVILKCHAPHGHLDGSTVHSNAASCAGDTQRKEYMPAWVSPPYLSQNPL
eukprot:scaffold25790_cov17-Tisochrysis_lutea.AAC.1